MLLSSTKADLRNLLLRSTTSLSETSVILGMWPTTSSLWVHQRLSRVISKRQDSVSSVMTLFVWDLLLMPPRSSEYPNILSAPLDHYLMLLESICGMEESSTSNSSGNKSSGRLESTKTP